MPKSKKGRRGHSGNRKIVDNPIKKFRMEVFRSPNIRAGLNRARLSITPEQIPSIVQEFSKNQMFFGNICEHRFPKSLSQLVHKKRLVLADSAREFMWSASVLSLFTSELSYFVSLRDTFEVSYLSGDCDGSKAALDEI